ncbi:MAG: flagellar basal body rod protein FlgB [Alphaproteobacteria bacterium]
MEITTLPLLRMMGERLDWLSRRTEVVAANIANADVPGYRSRDISAPDFARALQRAGNAEAVQRTSAQHLAARDTVAGAKMHDAADPGVARLDGNTVSLEHQLFKLGETQTDHSLVLGLYRKHMSLIRVALGRHG